MIVEKLWGSEEWVEHNDLYTMKLLTLQPGFQSSLHYHATKDETFLVIHGCCDLELPTGTRRLVPGEAQRIVPGTPHRFRAVNGACVVVECGTRHDDQDVIRIEESRRIA